MAVRRPVLVAGARPNFVKIAPLVRAFDEVGVEPLVVHTGQHYDRVMSDDFFDVLGIPAPTVNLDVGSGRHGAQTAAVMTAFESWLDGVDTDAVLVVGDVNSTVACALVAAKEGIPVGHVEAGLRAFDRSMPEEINRIVVDSLSTWLFTPSSDADANLRAEGVDPSRISRVGNVMVDSLRWSLDKALTRRIHDRLGLPDVGYGLVTLHRPALVDDPVRLAAMLSTLDEVASIVPLVFPLHPRTRAVIDRSGFTVDERRFHLVPPQGYLDFVALEAMATVVVTDSGGVQEETSVLGVPCITVRENTERPVTITRGTNSLVGFDHDRILDAVVLAVRERARCSDIPGWDGSASQRIVEILLESSAPSRFVPPLIQVAPLPEHRVARLHDAGVTVQQVGVGW